MHEYPVTLQIINIAEKHGKKFRASKVETIKLVVGEYSGFIGSSIQMYFDIISEGTLCEGAELIIEGVKPKLKCPNCHELFVRKPMTFACPNCGTDGHPSDIGKEFYIEYITLETEKGLETSDKFEI